MPFDLIANGLQIITERQIFDTGENGMEELICPKCNEDLSAEDWSFFNDWYEQKSNDLICPKCNIATNVHQFKISPDWGFSDLGFKFWNWPDFKEGFLEEFKLKLGCEIAIVYQHI